MPLGPLGQPSTVLEAAVCGLKAAVPVSSARPDPLVDRPAAASRFALRCQKGRSSDFRLNKVFPRARRSRPHPGQRPSHRLGLSAADAARARSLFSKPFFAPSPRQWRLVARRRPFPAPSANERAPDPLGLAAPECIFFQPL